MQFLRESASHLLQSQYDSIRTRLDEVTRLLHGPEQEGNNKNDDEEDDDEGLRLVSNFESLLVEFQSLLIWEKPYRTASSLTMFTFSYWILALWSPPIIAVMASLLFCYHFYEMWTRFVWPEIRVETNEPKEDWTTMNPNVLSAPEIERYLGELQSVSRKLIESVIQYRRHSHGAFCTWSVLILFLIYLIGRNIPGVILVYMFTICVFLAPGVFFYVLPNEVHEQVVEFFRNEPEIEEEPLATPVNSVNSLPQSATGSSKSSSSSQLSNIVENFFNNNSNSESNSNSRKSSASLDLEEFELIEEKDLFN